MCGFGIASDRVAYSLRTRINIEHGIVNWRHLYRALGHLQSDEGAKGVSVNDLVYETTFY